MAHERKSWSLRWRLGLGLVLTTLLPALLFSTVLLWGQWQRDEQSLLQRLDSNVRLQSSMIDDFLDTQLAGVRLIADRLPEEDPAAREKAMAQLLDVYPSILRVFVTDADGNVIAVRDTRGRNLPLLGNSLAQEASFKQVQGSTTGYITNAFERSAFGREVVVAAAAPLRHDGQFTGMLQAAIPVQSFARLSSDSLARRDLKLLLVDRTDHVVYAGSGLNWKLLEEVGGVSEHIRRTATGADRPGKPEIRVGVLSDGKAAYVQSVRMRNGWLLVLIAPREILLAPLWPRIWLVLGLLAITLVGLLWALWQQRRVLQSSLNRLLAGLRGYALGGTMGASEDRAMPTELQPLATGIGELGARMNRAFDELQHVLSDRESVIEERTESLRNAVAELDHLSRTDALTGCLNYRGFEETGAVIWNDTRGSGQPFSVLALDIDFFKRYNDLYGHAAGDGALRRFSGAVRSALQNPDDVLARPGGEEFTAFLPGVSCEQAQLIAERVLHRVRDADIEHADSPTGKLTVSIGVACVEPGDATLKSLLLRADAALYHAKAAGRNQVSAARA